MVSKNRSALILAVIARYAIYAVAGLIPLATISVGGFVLWETPKVALLNILTLIALAAWTNEQVPSGSIRTRFPPAFGFVLAYFVVYVAATVFSLSPVLSVFGISHRSTGLINLANLVVLYLLAFNVLVSREHRITCLKIVTLSASLVALVGVMQYFGIDPVRTGLVQKGERVISTLGNADYLTPVVIIAIPLALAFIFGNSLPLSQKGDTGGFCLLLKSPLVPLFQRGRRRYFRNKLLYAGCLVLLLAALVFSLPVPGITGDWAPAGAVHSESLSGAMGEDAPVFFRAAAGRVDVRLGLWEAGIKAALERPILGTGPNTYRDVFTRYVPSSYARAMVGYHEDKVHNEFIEVAQSTGLVGLALYLLMLGSLLWSLIRWTKDHPKDPDTYLVAGIAVAVIAYVAYTFMVFHTIAAYSLFWILLAVGGGLCSHRHGGLRHPSFSEPVQARKHRWRILTTRGISLMAVTVIGLVALRPLLADVSLARARGMNDTGPEAGTTAAAWYQKAADLHPYELIYLKAAGHAFSALGVAAGNAPMAESAFREAIYYIDRAVAQEPGNASVYYARAFIYARSGRSAGEVRKELDKAIELFPNYFMAYVARADVERALGNYRRSMTDRQTALALFPDNTNLMVEIGYDAYRAGRIDEAIAVTEKAISGGNKSPRASLVLDAAYQMKEAGGLP